MTRFFYCRCLLRRFRIVLLVLSSSLLLLLLLVGACWYGAVQWIAQSSSDQQSAVGLVDCPEVSVVHRKQLFVLLYRTSRLLDEVRLTHFLCYTSLWGAVQEAGPFPWEPHAHLCALNSQDRSYDEPALLRLFRKWGLTLDYSSAEADYRVTNTSLHADAPHVQITLFEEDPRVGVSVYRRVGWKRRLLPPNCEGHHSLQCFPASLVVRPLPTRTFGPLTLPTPRDNIDLLKFHYPLTWYKPVQAVC